jgi:two-component system OmpR family sensor kinase
VPASSTGSHAPHSFPGHHFSGASGLEPAGTIGELINHAGKVVGKRVTVIYSGKALPALTLPTRLPAVSSTGSVYFTTTSHGTSYRVIMRSLHYQHLIVVAAIPLTDVEATLHHLLLVELLVSGGVLLVLAVLTRFVVRRGLRPLEDMAQTAGEIAGGELGRRVTPADDHTEVGRLGQALNAMLNEIEEAFAARAASEDRLRRFLADASHELRTPLTSIRGYAELFDRGARERPDDLEASMRHIKEDADRMTVLVDDLLLLARLDRERPLELEATDVVPLVGRSVEAARLVEPDRVIRLQSPDHLVLAVDTDRLRQVADNLITNALRHSPKGRSVEVGLRSTADAAELTVRDHGPGVAPEDVDRIFEPFYRADFARARSKGGAGLGLAIVAAIVRAHGGTVGVRNAEGDGAEFWCRLPLAETGAGPYGQFQEPSGTHQDPSRGATAVVG